MSSRNCEEYVCMVQDDLVGELEEAKRLELLRHLEGCESCNHEAQIFGAILKEVRSLKDETVPQHFFVYEEPKNSFWQVLAKMPPVWKWGLSTAMVVLMVFVGLAAAGTQIRYGDGDLVVQFGQSQDLTREDVRDQVMAAVREVSEEYREEILSSLREEFSATLTEAVLSQKHDLESRLQGVETRLNSSLELRTAALQANIEASMGRLGNVLVAQHQLDMNQVRQRLDRSASINRLHANQNDVILNTLAQWADKRIR